MLSLTAHFAARLRLSCPYPFPLLSVVTDSSTVARPGASRFGFRFRSPFLLTCKTLAHALTCGFVRFRRSEAMFSMPNFSHAICVTCVTPLVNSRVASALPSHGASVRVCAKYRQSQSVSTVSEVLYQNFT